MLDVLRLDGVVLLSDTLGRYPGDPEWAPLLDELDRRATYVLVHPAWPPYSLPLAEQPAWIYEFPFETTRAIASLISAGAPDRWTRIRFQAAHLGGTIPFLADRLTALADATSTRAFLRRLFYDTALRDDPATLAATSEFAGRSQIVLGSDWPHVDTIDAHAARYGSIASRLLSPSRLRPWRPNPTLQ